MLSISDPIKGGRGEYYVGLSKEDYYSLERPGFWSGKGAAILGLKGTVRSDVFRACLNGHAPDGTTPLVQNAGFRNRQQGWDLTFSAPKALSVFWALLPEPKQHLILQAHRRAVDHALWIVEHNAVASRRRHKGISKDKAEIPFACFEHYTSRRHDPQIHTHAVLLNIGIRPDLTTGTLYVREVFKQKLFFGNAYRNELSRILREELFLILTPERFGFHIQGVPKALCHELSKGRRAIEEKLAEQNLSGAIAAKAAALSTRPKKEKHSAADLYPEWEKVARSYGFGRREAEALLKVSKTEWQEANRFKGKLTVSNSPEIKSIYSAQFEAARFSTIFRTTPRKSKQKPRKRRWGNVHWKKDLFFADLVAQEKILWPNAPKWSAAFGKKLPVLRIKGKAPLLEALSGKTPTHREEEASKRATKRSSMTMHY